MSRAEEMGGTTATLAGVAETEVGGATKASIGVGIEEGIEVTTSGLLRLAPCVA